MYHISCGSTVFGQSVLKHHKPLRADGGDGCDETDSDAIQKRRQALQSHTPGAPNKFAAALLRAPMTGGGGLAQLSVQSDGKTHRFLGCKLMSSHALLRAGVLYWWLSSNVAGVLAVVFRVEAV